MTLTQEITLDIYDPPYFEYVNAKQADNVSRILIVTLTAHGEQIKPSAGTETAVFRALKPDRTSVIDPAAIGGDGKITVALTDQALACPGRVEADISVLKGDEVLSSATFYIQVDRAPVSGEQIVSSDEFLVMLEATREATAAAGEARQAAGEAGTAAGKADTATGRANDAAKLLEGMTVSASDVEPGGKATAALTKQGDHYDLALGLVKGDKGDTGSKGEKGDTGPTGPQGPVGPAGGVDSVNGKTGDVVIGGRNYVRHSSPALYPDGWYSNGALNKNLEISPDGYAMAPKFIGNYLSVETPFGLNKKLEPGVYTISYTAYASIQLEYGAYTEGKFRLLNLITRSSGDQYTLTFDSPYDKIDTTPKRYTCTFEITSENEIGDGWVFCLAVYSSYSEKPDATLYLKDVKIEKGTVATDWSPAPEDIPSMAPVQSVNGAQGDVLIGARNYISSGKSFRRQLVDLSYDSKTCTYEVTAVGTGGFQQLVVFSPIRDISVIRDSTYPLIFSVDSVSCTDPNARVGIFVGFSKKEGSSYTEDGTGEADIWASDGARSAQVTWNRGNRTDTVESYLIFRIDQNQTAPIGTKLTVRGLRLSIGTVPLDWTPSSEDILERLTALEAKAGITYEPPVIEGPEIMGGEDMRE